ncbi:MAG: hypothetical protein Q9M36_04515 [Sulfurovum sp.]|nr:hypothetical protein [Sulfurovum sp.]
MEHITTILNSMMGTDYTINDLSTSLLSNVIEEVYNGLSYSCINYDHDNIQYIASKELKYKIIEVTDLMKKIFENHTKVFSFYIEEEHPFYHTFLHN